MFALNWHTPPLLISRIFLNVCYFCTQSQMGGGGGLTEVQIQRENTTDSCTDGRLLPIIIPSCRARNTVIMMR